MFPMLTPRQIWPLLVLVLFRDFIAGKLKPKDFLITNQLCSNEPEYFEQTGITLIRKNKKSPCTSGSFFKN